MRIESGLLLLLWMAPAVGRSQNGSVAVPVGTPLAARTPKHLPMAIGQAVDAQLLYPVYVDNRLVLAADAVHLAGTVTGLTPDRSRRVGARLRGDFTPFYTPVVRFDRLVLANGTVIPIQTTPAADGAPIFRLVAPPPRKGGLIRQQIDTGIQMAKDRLAIVTGPEKRDRLIQFLYTQLPYHPQRIAKDTAWTVETTAPVSAGAVVSGADGSPAPLTPTGPGAQRNDPVTAPTWMVNAFLAEPLNSQSTKAGQAIHATVAEPIYNADHTLAVPEGATLDGAVTQVRPARRFGRAGVLRFDFRQITMPSGESQNVQASVAGIDAAGGASLAMDSEGKVKPKTQDKVLVPLILLSLAGRPLDRDRGDNQFGKDAVASNALGLVGFIVGTAAGQRNLAAGIGYYGTAIALYNRWIKRGAEVTFARDTRIVVQTTARRSAMLTPGLR